MTTTTDSNEIAASPRLDRESAGLPTGVSRAQHPLHRRRMAREGPSVTRALPRPTGGRSRYRSGPTARSHTNAHRRCTSKRPR